MRRHPENRKNITYRNAGRRDNNRPKWSQGAEETEDAKDAEDLWTVLGGERDDDVQQGDEDQTAVHHVPTTPQVRVTTQHETLRYHLRPANISSFNTGRREVLQIYIIFTFFKRFNKNAYLF